MEGESPVAAEWEEVFIAADYMEAELIRGLLEANGIPVVTEARGTQAMPFYFGHGAVGGEIGLRVPPDRADEARNLLAARAEEEEPEP